MSLVRNLVRCLLPMDCLYPRDLSQPARKKKKNAESYYRAGVWAEESETRLGTVASLYGWTKFLNLVDGEYWGKWVQLQPGVASLYGRANLESVVAHI